MKLSCNLLAFVAAAALFATAQTNSKQSESSAPAVQRDANAITVLTQAVAALGGEANIAAVHDCVASGNFSAKGQTWLRFTAFVWKNSQKEYSYEVSDSDGKTSIDRSGHGKPSLEIDGKKRPRHSHTPISSSPTHLIALRLLEVLRDPKYDAIFNGTDTLNGRAVFKVRTRNNSDEIEAALTQQDWFFDENYIPVRVEYQVGENSNALDLTKMAADLAAYAPFDGVMVPMQITFSMNGQTGATAKITSIRFNSGVSSSDFD